MQHKKSQHNGILKEFFANIIISKRKLMNTLENSTRHKTKAIIVLNIGKKGLPRSPSMDMASPLGSTLPHQALS
jgi:hypothetical protein